MAKMSSYGHNMHPPSGQHSNASLLEHLLVAATTTATTLDEEEHELSKFGRPLLTFAGVMTILIMIVGICGNLLTIVALLKCPKVRNVAAAFIISLCVADCLFCVMVLPFHATRYINGRWTHGELLCRLVPFVQYGNVGVSLLSIAMITINRYIMITHHSAYARIYKRRWITAMIVLCWVISFGTQLPTMFGVWGKFGYDTKLGTCSILPDANGRTSKTTLFVVAFVIPCIIIIGCYAQIFWVVHASEVRMRRHATKQNSIPNNLRPMPAPSNNNAIPAGGSGRLPSQSNLSSSDAEGTGAPESPTTPTSPMPSSTALRPGAALQQKISRVKDQRDAKAKRNEWRITKMVLAIFLSFVACYLPITLMKIFDRDVQYPVLQILSYILLYMSACINPIIYVIMNKQYRQAYKSVVLCHPRRLLAFTQGGSTVGEKWKDIGYSYNHSRTMVSQVSIAEESASSAASEAAAAAVRPPRCTPAHRDSARPNSRLPVIPDSNELHI